MGRLFGTDGIRGVAGRPPLSSADIRAIGRAAGGVLKRKTSGKGCRILGVRDTRASGTSIFNDLSSGLREMGIHVFDGGVMSTPAASFLVREHRFQSGVVISASHNPPEFNGIKFFNGSGRKWPDEWEEMVEKIFFNRRPGESRGPMDPGLRRDDGMGELVDAASLKSDYEHFLIGTLGKEADLSGLRVAVDCSNGANFESGPRVLRKLGAEVFVIGAAPTGTNINVSCGSQHPEKLARLVKAKRCHAGVAFDGDGDRLILVDEKGRIIDGDYTIALLSKRLLDRKELSKRQVVITVMANLGLKKALEKIRVKAVEVQVGDRYVSAAMQKHGADLGGEQSGHIILGRHLPTGDGLLTALHVLAAIKAKKKTLSTLTGWMKKYPQVLLNVPVKKRVPLENLNGTREKIRGVEKALGSNGRVLVRYSGTEPLLRIMLEGPDKKKIETMAHDIASSVKRAMNLL